MSVLTELATAGRVVRPSTSSGITRTDTGQAIAGSNGVHLFVLVQNGTDVGAFPKTLHARCWLAELGWMMIGAGGQLLERSIVDRTVAGPNDWCSRPRRSLNLPGTGPTEARRSLLHGGILDTPDNLPGPDHRRTRASARTARRRGKPPAPGSCHGTRRIRQATGRSDRRKPDAPSLQPCRSSSANARASCCPRWSCTSTRLSMKAPPLATCWPDP